MLNIPSKLAARTDPVQVGVIGSGLFGTNLIDQLEPVTGLEASVVADIITEKAVDTLQEAGVPSDEVVIADDAAEVRWSRRPAFPTLERDTHTRRSRPRSTW
jgi:predicted homoserine dehydrogenase-like protein